MFHFSEEAGLTRFEPRPVRMPSARGHGREWLNGPLVWAIDEDHQPLYLFPRDCPRIVIWATPNTTAADRDTWLGAAPMAAFVEKVWIERIESATLWRYHLPETTFEDLGDAGMWVSRTAVKPIAAEQLTDLPRALDAFGVKLTPVASLKPLRALWNTTLHASGVRLRNATTWTALPMVKQEGSDGL